MLPPRRDIRDRCSEFERRCRAQGVRITPQRLAVYRILAEDSSHPTAESVFERLRRAMPALSQATVYRILDSLEKEGLIRRVSTTGGGARFDANLSDHQHLVCRICGAMRDFSSPSLTGDALAPEVRGFSVESLDIRIVGRCADCARRVSAPARSGKTAHRLSRGRC